jgi:hypothetical protein
MSGKRQKIQYSLASEPQGRGEAPVSGSHRAEPLAAKPAPESPAATEQLMEEVSTERICKVRGSAFEGTRAVLAWMG